MELRDLDANVVNSLNIKLEWFRGVGKSVATSIPNTRKALALYHSFREPLKPYRILIKGIQHDLRPDWRVEPAWVLRRYYNMKADDLVSLYVQTDPEVGWWWLHVNRKVFTALKGKGIEFYMLYWFVSFEPTPEELEKEEKYKTVELEPEKAEELDRPDAEFYLNKPFAVRLETELEDGTLGSYFPVSNLITRYDSFLENSYADLSEQFLRHYSEYELYLEGYVVKSWDVFRLGYMVQELAE
jgi:hypothetical protein